MSSIPIPLEGPIAGKVFELVRVRISFRDPSGAIQQRDVIDSIEPVMDGTIYRVKPGYKSEYDYFQSIDGKLVQGFSSRDLLIV